MNRTSLIRSWKFARNAIASLLAVLVVVLMMPARARSQLGLDPCCAIITAGLSTISNLLSSVVAKPIAAIQQIEQQAANFEQQVVYPVTAINQAKAVAVQAQGQFTQMRQIFQTPVSSATLAVPRQL